MSNDKPTKLNNQIIKLDDLSKITCVWDLLKTLTNLFNNLVIQFSTWVRDTNQRPANHGRRGDPIQERGKKGQCTMNLVEFGLFLMVFSDQIRRQAFERIIIHYFHVMTMMRMKRFERGRIGVVDYWGI